MILNYSKHTFSKPQRGNGKGHLAAVRGPCTTRAWPLLHLCMGSAQMVQQPRTKTGKAGRQGHETTNRRADMPTGCLTSSIRRLHTDKSANSLSACLPARFAGGERTSTFSVPPACLAVGNHHCAANQLRKGLAYIVSIRSRRKSSSLPGRSILANCPAR